MPDPERDFGRAEIINSSAVSNAVAAGSVLVLLSWPLARLLVALRRAVQRR